MLIVNKPVRTVADESVAIYSGIVLRRTALGADESNAASRKRGRQLMIFARCTFIM